MREATATEAKVTSNPDVQIELASEVGIDIVDFIKAIRSGEAETKFKADMAITQSTGVSGFPSFLIKTSEARQVLVRGYKTFAEFKEIISYLTGDSLNPIQVTPSFEGLSELLDQHSKLALEEVRQAFDIPTQTEADEWLEQLVKDGKLNKEAAGTSYFVRMPSKFTCDTTTEIC